MQDSVTTEKDEKIAEIIEPWIPEEISERFLNKLSEEYNPHETYIYRYDADEGSDLVGHIPARWLKIRKDYIDVEKDSASIGIFDEKNTGKLHLSVKAHGTRKDYRIDEPNSSKYLERARKTNHLFKNRFSPNQLPIFGKERALGNKENLITYIDENQTESLGKIWSPNYLENIGETLDSILTGILKNEVNSKKLHIEEETKSVKNYDRFLAVLINEVIRAKMNFSDQKKQRYEINKRLSEYYEEVTGEYYPWKTARKNIKKLINGLKDPKKLNNGNEISEVSKDRFYEKVSEIQKISLEEGDLKDTWRNFKNRKSLFNGSMNDLRDTEFWKNHSQEYESLDKGKELRNLLEKN